MKILFILELYYPNIGGIEKLFKSLAEKLAEQGHEITVITTRFRKDLPAREEINGVKIKRLKIRSRFVFSFFGIFGMMKEARNCDIIHTTSFNAALPARLAGWLSGKKAVITFHEAWGRLWFRLPFTCILKKTLFYAYEWLILHLRFHSYIAVSDYTAKCLKDLGVKKERIERVYNGLDYHEYEPGKYEPPENFVLTYFGRLGISKGIDLMLSAVPPFLQKHPDACFKMIVPEHPARLLRRIKKAVRDLPEHQFILMHNLSRRELHQELQRSSCTVIPSYSEGFCYAAAESIALGVPLITSGKGALQEVVSGKHLTMHSHDAEGLGGSLEKAYRGEWEDLPVRKFHFRDTLEQYLSLYADESTEKRRAKSEK